MADAAAKGGNFLWKGSKLFIPGLGGFKTAGVCLSLAFIAASVPSGGALAATALAEPFFQAAGEGVGNLMQASLETLDI